MSGPSIDDTGFHVHEHGGATGVQGWLNRIVDGLKSIYGDAIDVDPDSPDGQLTGILAEIVNDREQGEHNNYLMNSPAGAVGAALSRLVQLNGIMRKAAQFSTAAITLGGTPGIIIPINTLILVGSDPEIPPFKTVAPYTIGGGGTISGQAVCTVAGPFNVAAGDLDTKGVVISGWTSVTNPTAAAPGRLVETDPVLRVRRAQSVAMPSQSMLDGLYAALADLSGVDDVVVYENTKNSVDDKGHPPHSIHVIIDGGIDADIANAIWVKSSMGATKVGDVVQDVTDTQGNPQEMRWDVPVDFDVYITVQLNRTPNTFEEDSIKAALVAFGQETSRIGQNVPWGDLFSPVNDLDITGGPGLPSVMQIRLGSTPTPTLQVDLVVPFNARPRYDAARVLVVGP